MFKRVKYIVGFSISLLVGATSCNDWLDVKPDSQIILEDFWKSESDVESVIASCYRDLTRDDVIGRMIIWGELRSDNMTIGGVIPSARYGIQQILEGNLTSSNAFCSWGAYYSVINYCNTVLYYAPSVMESDENFTLDDLHYIQTEALTIRALCYFYLVRAFKEVPWIEEASVDDTQNFNYAKSTETEILDRIISDLLLAKQYARTDYGTVAYNKGRVTLNTVNSLLADIYLWSQQYDKCVDACNEVLSDKQLKLTKSQLMYSTVFYTGNSSESIFELQFKDNVQVNNPVFRMYGTSGYPVGDVSFPVALVSDPLNKVNGQYSPFNYSVSSTIVESKDDIRAKDFINTYYGGNTGSYYIFKYVGVLRNENTTGISTYLYRSTTPNWIVYRLSDIMLMKAEALVQMGESNYHEAIKMVNGSYLRSNPLADSLKVENYPSKFEMEKLVLRERQRELMFEGKRWFDLVRAARRDNSTSILNGYVEKKGSTNSVSLSVPTLNAMYMPINIDELKANSNLKQNPYYEAAGSSF